MTRSFLIGLILASALPAWSASASDADVRNRASFTVDAVREIANDWATARLSVFAEGKDPAAVADSVNTQMAAAVKTAKRSEGIEIRSGSYTTQPIYDEGRIVRWRAQQELRLESGDVDRLSRLIGVLQGGSALLSGIDFSVKRETREVVEEELISEALAAFQGRAALIAKGMGTTGWSLIHLSVDHSGTPPRMMQMRAEADMVSRSKAAPPSFEAGTSRIEIQISGNVELD